jgi:predicted RND superfamily exporter protein
VAARERVIAEVRDIRDHYADAGTLYLAGVPMIAADMVQFVKNDLVLFGTSVVALIMVALFLFFRRLRWVLLPVRAGAGRLVLRWRPSPRSRAP